MLYLHTLRIPKSSTPPPLWNFLFSDPLGFLCDFVKLLTNGKHVLPFLPSPSSPLSKKILPTIFCQAKKFRFVNIPFLSSCYLQVAYHQIKLFVFCSLRSYFLESTCTPYLYLCKTKVKFMCCHPPYQKFIHRVTDDYY